MMREVEWTGDSRRPDTYRDEKEQRASPAYHIYSEKSLYSIKPLWAKVSKASTGLGYPHFNNRGRVQDE
jgi:hypothetical protein